MFFESSPPLPDTFFLSVVCDKLEDGEKGVNISVSIETVNFDFPWPLEVNPYYFGILPRSLCPFFISPANISLVLFHVLYATPSFFPWSLLVFPRFLSDMLQLIQSYKYPDQCQLPSLDCVSNSISRISATSDPQVPRGLHGNSLYKYSSEAPKWYPDWLRRM